MSRSGKCESERSHRGTAGKCAKPRVRDRIFDAARALFYRQGIRCVGVDAIVCEAGTNKMSFYRSFPSKDDLISEYLSEHEIEYWTWWDETIARHAGEPRRQIEALFAATVARGRGDDCHGCAFANAAVELREASHPALTIVHEGKAEVRKRLRKLAREAGARSPEVLGDALTLLMEGCVMSRLSFAAESWPGAQVPKIVKVLLDAHIG